MLVETKARVGVFAIALGAFIRPTENLMFSLGGSMAANKDVMGNIGVSYRFGGPTASSASVPDLRQKVADMSVENRDLGARLEAAGMRLEAQSEALADAQRLISEQSERLSALEELTKALKAGR